MQVPTRPFAPLKRTVWGVKMQLTKEIKWISAKNFEKTNPAEFVIVAVEQNGNDYIMRLESGDDIVQMSLWGKVKNDLIEMFGDETNAWLGRKIKLKSTPRDGKNIREVVKDV